MKKLQVFGISFFILIFCFSLVSGVRINEVELNPEGEDSGNEWVELYSDTEINLTDWKIMNNDGDNITLNFSFSDYYVINTNYGFLTNDNQKLFLINFENNTIDETIEINDGSNDNRTWQYCGGDWIFANFTRGQENLCEEPEPENGDEEPEDNETSDIYLELDYDKAVRNGETFKIKVRAFNLLDEKYDVKVYVYDEDEDTTLSETYHEVDEDWMSGTYYVSEIFEEEGNHTETFKLRIRGKHEDFEGDVKIIAKIRDGDDDVIDEIEDDIEIEEKREEVKQESKQEETTIGQVITGDVIKLNAPKNIKIEETEENQEYKSKTQYIKEYGIYLFALFCVIIIVLLVLKIKKDR